MKRIIVAGRNDGGKSTLIGEIYSGLKGKDYQPLVIGSGIQDEKPFLSKGIDSTYLIIAAAKTGEDVSADLDKVIKLGVNQIKERNGLIQQAKRAADELNKLRSVLGLSQIQQKDLPKINLVPDVALVESVGINDGYRSQDSRKMADILVTVVPAGIKTEILMTPGNMLLDEADLIVVTKLDETPRSTANTNIKLLERIYSNKPIFSVVATEGLHVEYVIEEIIKRLQPYTQAAAEGGKK